MATIMHVDMDAFYAAVEILDNPEYAGKPRSSAATDSRRGVVSTCSYEAQVRYSQCHAHCESSCPLPPRDIHSRPHGPLSGSI